MMKQYQTEQENFWAGEFTKQYINRNQDEQLLASNLAFFSGITKHFRHVESILEFGANVGMNLLALRRLLPEAHIAAVEINAAAAAKLEEDNRADQVFQQSILEFDNAETYDFVFTKGVLIHINPDFLDQVYETMYRASSRYICVAEYYNPSPVSIQYRGHDNKLFKRDFAGELMIKYPDLKLLDYGFAYRKDPVFPQDDITWFLLEKQ